MRLSWACALIRQPGKFSASCSGPFLYARAANSVVDAGRELQVCLN
jgi:hypothetical protein